MNSRKKESTAYLSNVHRRFRRPVAAKTWNHFCPRRVPQGHLPSQPFHSVMGEGWRTWAKILCGLHPKGTCRRNRSCFTGGGWRKRASVSRKRVRCSRPKAPSPKSVWTLFGPKRKAVNSPKKESTAFQSKFFAVSRRGAGSSAVTGSGSGTAGSVGHQR